jgi:hypothetical protein
LNYKTQSNNPTRKVGSPLHPSPSVVEPPRALHFSYPSAGQGPHLYHQQSINGQYPSQSPYNAPGSYSQWMEEQLHRHNALTEPVIPPTPWVPPRPPTPHNSAYANFNTPSMVHELDIDNMVHRGQSSASPNADPEMTPANTPLSGNNGLQLQVNHPDWGDGFQFQSPSLSIEPWALLQVGYPQIQSLRTEVLTTVSKLPK